MEDIVAVLMLSRRLRLEEPELMLQSVTDRDQIETYISLSIKIAVAREVDTTAYATNKHPLALLAEQTKKLLKKDATMFMPILSQRHPQAIVVSASLFHKLYWNKLKPFVSGAEHLTEDVVSVFPAAYGLEQYVMSLIISVCEEATAEAYFRKLTLYKIETTSGTLVLCWVNLQLGRILGWVERAIQQEHWEPVSPQQRHGSSIVEIYRIVEETVDQFFALKVPMRLGELNSLLRGIDNAFRVYTKTVIDKLGIKSTMWYNCGGTQGSRGDRSPSSLIGWLTSSYARWRGPSRIFTTGDAKLMEEDLEVLKEFFISGGDGLPRGVVENQVACVRQVVKLHSYETRELIEDLRSASGLEMKGGKSKLGADTKTLLRILCHRSDSEASQFLKKQFKVPKSAA